MTSPRRKNKKNGGNAWPAAKVELRPVAALKPYKNNARTHSQEQILQIVQSVREWGWTNPVLADEKGLILAGHGRVLAAKELGLDAVPVVVARGWSEAQKRAYILADNQLALNAGWDLTLLKAEVQGLNEWGFDVSLLGFDNLPELLAADVVGLTDPDAAPPLPAVPVSRPGDLWHLGKHRLLCGDATLEPDVATVLGDDRPHLMVTDPPYGVNYDPAWRLRAGISSGGAAVGAVPNDDRADWRTAWRLFPGSVAYVWHGGLHAPVAAESLAACGFGIRAQIVWIKTRAALSRGHYHWQHEPCLYAVKPEEDDRWRFVPEHELAAYAVKQGSTADWRGGRKQSTVWFIEHLKSDTGHAAQKPVACMQRPLENNSRAGDAVYDPFLGSGTTVIAAELTGRSCFGLEIDPGYCDVVVKRWQDFTGKDAVHADGRRFRDLVLERVGTENGLSPLAAAEQANPI